jgi:hypothetical protein
MKTRQLYPAQLAVWKDGDPLQNVVTGTINYPTGGVSTMATTAGPSLGANPVPFNVNSSSYSVTQGVVTVAAVVAAASPAQTFFGVVTYATNTGPPPTNESLISVPFVINTVAGINPTISVSATGAPGSATTFGVYMGFLPNTYTLQSAATALGAAYTILYPLTNSQGVNKAASGATSGILGIADVDSDAYFAGILGATAGGSINTGKRALFGATQSFQPGWTNDPFALPATDLRYGELELSLKQAWYPSLVESYAAVGFSYDVTTGYMVADTTQTGATFQDTAFGAGLNTAYAPNPGDTGARVRIKFLQSALS